jgi:hypothetical protein
MSKTLQKVKHGVYKNRFGRPMRPDVPVLSPFATQSEIEDYQIDVDKFKQQMEQYNNTLSKYNNYCTQLDNMFRSDLEQEFNMSNHPKRYIIWDLAYSRGHYSGKEEIAHQYQSLYELVK